MKPNSFFSAKSLTQPSSPAFSIAVAIFYAAVLVGASILMGFPFQGSPSYGQIGAQFLRDGYFETAYRPPLYPFYLATCQWMFGTLWTVGAVIGQILFAAFSCGVSIFLTGWIFKKVGPALLASLLWLVNIPFHLEMLNQRETSLYVALQLAATLCFLTIRTWYFRAASIGIIVGLAHLTRPDCILPPLFLSLLIVAPTVEGKEWKFSGQGILAFLTAFLLFATVTAPWEVAIRRISGRYTIGSATTLGINLWKGNNPYFYDYFPLMEVDRVEDKMREVLGGRRLEDAESDVMLQNIAFRYILSDPLGAVARSLYKALFFFSPTPIPLATGNLTPGESNLEMTSIRFINPLLIVGYSCFSLLLYVGTFLGIRSLRKLGTIGQLFLAVAFGSCVLRLLLHMVMFYESRFRLPLEPLIIVLSSCGFYAFLAVRYKKRAILSRGTTTQSFVELPHRKQPI